MTASSSRSRLIRKLRDALGETICAALENVDVVEVMLNPDGRLFVERLGEGIERIGELKPGAAEIIIGSVAHALQTEVDEDQPIISGELPIDGHRFEGLLPPVVSAPSFTIRRRASRLIPLSDYVSSGVMTKLQAGLIRHAVHDRLNIVVSGGTGSGKTTLANAVIAEIVNETPAHRLLILEDTAEIQCAAENAVCLHTTDTVDMGRLLKSTMRLRPDRIIVGEVRDGAAQHPTPLCTALICKGTCSASIRCPFSRICLEGVRLFVPGVESARPARRRSSFLVMTTPLKTPAAV